MGITKTDYMRGIQCEHMLWLDHHKRDARIIPLVIRQRLDQGNAFGDACMGIFGDYTEVKEYIPGTEIPNKRAMAAKTRHLVSEGVSVICEAAFLDAQGNYCAADILCRDAQGDGWSIYEVKDAATLGENLVEDLAFQVYLIRRQQLHITKASIIFHPQEPYVIQDVTEQVEQLQPWVEGNLPRLMAIREQKEEPCSTMGHQCQQPYDCWYRDYCTMQQQDTLTLRRCPWCEGRGMEYLLYHDREWGHPVHRDDVLYEQFILETFQAGLSWETILHKRDNFRMAFEGFHPEQVAAFTEQKVQALLQDPGIVRSRAKIKAAIENSKVFLAIQQEFGTFDAYLWHFTDGKTLLQADPYEVTSELSDTISKDLKRRGMSFCGSATVQAYLQAVGVLNAHFPNCFCFRKD